MSDCKGKVLARFSPKEKVFVDCVGGNSNTPHSTKFVNVCVDYLSIRFRGQFDRNDRDFLELCAKMFVDEGLLHKDAGRNFYSSRFDAAVGTCFLFGGSMTVSDGSPTWMLEMKGSGCRAFEERVASLHSDEDAVVIDWFVRIAWDALIRQIWRMGGECTRIDLPTDDFSGIVPFDGLKERCSAENRCYVSSMRALNVVNKFPQVDDLEIFNVIDSRKAGKNGWSATLGSRKSVQLCIYDKKAERASKGFDVIVSSWIRYEVRFYHDNAKEAFSLLMMAFESPEPNSVADFIVGCLSGCVRFLESGSKNRSNRSMIRTWAPWESFVSGFDGVRVVSQARAESSVLSNARWLKEDVSRTLARIIASDNVNSDGILRYLYCVGLAKIDDKDLILINQYRVERGLGKYRDVDELRHALLMGNKAIKPIDDEWDESVDRMFGSKPSANGSARITGFGWGKEN